ncbi:MAG: NADH-ubiquinone oxidoreductase-F iron-sulfur binding region domain-containing protein [bacterium]|nr:NADH-ubiquinone oxidoreductase-F iron-sulfur binding region domain-containing protein [bacterium]
MAKIFRTHILVSIDPETLLSGAKGIYEKFKKEVEASKLSNEVMVAETGNLGISNKGVVVVVYPEGVIYVNVKADDVTKIMNEHIIKGRIVKDLVFSGEKVSGSSVKMELPKQNRVVLKGSGEVDPESLEEYIGIGGYEGLGKVLFEMKPQDVIDAVKKSGLRGRGGAGFPTGLKWSFTAPLQGEKYVICNADEGEPGTFKDRLIMEGVPFRLIEGMTIAGYAIGASKGFIYIRGEYALSIEKVNKAIETARKNNLLGKNILESTFSFDIEVRKGAGAYVCGEETSLIESMEGKRGNPRNKPPFPGVKGFRMNPSVVNNVETLANVPAIAVNGADWYKKLGTEKCPGTKVFTLMGDILYPGLIEVEMGTTLKDVVYKFGGGIKEGKKFKAALIGGAAGAFISEKGLDVKMDFDSLGEWAAVLGSGAVLVMSEDRDPVETLNSILEFFKHESCGKCSPCRIGTKRLELISKDIMKGRATEGDWETMKELSYTMKLTSFCPLGQSPYIPISSFSKYLEDDMKKNLNK